MVVYKYTLPKIKEYLSRMPVRLCALYDLVSYKLYNYKITNNALHTFTCKITLFIGFETNLTDLLDYIYFFNTRIHK